ncbi:MAG: TetR family transcriptional regulator C-terminal domain-containing protein [Desulfatiglans sp.]|jgi:TetR/AcrR family transcriptional repressor of nem operon|nr:TetR family transcriptional regulator C-terminal domain-containing protein [Desulfatiglans sp.]
MKEETKNRIIEAASELIHLKGFNHTGLQEILANAGAPKGSFYYYFKNKDDLGLHVVDYFISFFSLLTKPIREDSSLSPLDKIRKILDQFIPFFESKGFGYGCPIGNLAQEMGDLNPAFRPKLKEAMDLMADIYAKLLEEAQAAGEIADSLDIRETAYFIVSSWHGALTRMKIEKGPGPLENHRYFIFKHILNS